METSTALTRICADLWRDPEGARDMAEFTLGTDANGYRYRILLMNGIYHLEATDDIEGNSAHVQARWEPRKDPTGMPRFHETIQDWLYTSDVKPSKELRAANRAGAKADEREARERYRLKAESECFGRIDKGPGCTTIEGIKTVEEFGTALLEMQTQGKGFRWTLSINGDTYAEQRTNGRKLPTRVAKTLADLMNPHID